MLGPFSLVVLLLSTYFKCCMIRFIFDPGAANMYLDVGFSGFYSPERTSFLFHPPLDIIEILYVNMTLNYRYLI